VAVKAVKGIICDVGHVIYQGSALNFILSRIGRSDVAKVLYDTKVLGGAPDEDIEAWVREVIGEKVAAMRGRAPAEIAAIAREIPFTRGFPELLDAAAPRGVPVALMSAVPAFVIEASIEGLGRSVDRVLGTSVRLDDLGRIVGADEVCTPRGKAARVAGWMRERSLDPAGCAVIGDSIGDLHTMALVPADNRISFNASFPQVLELTSVHFEEDMHALADHLFGPEAERS
jgi:phosphoserine phosphatase